MASMCYLSRGGIGKRGFESVPEKEYNWWHVGRSHQAHYDSVPCHVSYRQRCQKGKRALWCQIQNMLLTRQLSINSNFKSYGLHLSLFIAPMLSVQPSHHCDLLIPWCIFLLPQSFTLYFLSSFFSFLCFRCVHITWPVNSNLSSSFTIYPYYHL